MFCWVDDLKNQFINILLVSVVVLISRGVFGSSFPGVLLGLIFFSPLAISLLQKGRTTPSSIIRSSFRGKSLLYSIHMIFIVIASASVPGLVYAAFHVEILPLLIFSFVYSVLFILSSSTFFGLADYSSKIKIAYTDMAYIFFSMALLGAIHYAEKNIIVYYPMLSMFILFLSSFAIILIFCMQVLLIVYRYQK
jgi:hypothetical protein